MNDAQFEFDLTPNQGWEPDDKPIRLTPTAWKSIRAVARQRFFEIDQTGMLTCLESRRLGNALRAALAAGEFAPELVPTVQRIVALLGQQRGLLVQRRSAIAGSALRVDSGEPAKQEPVRPLAAKFENFRMDKGKPAR